MRGQPSTDKGSPCCVLNADDDKGPHPQRLRVGASFIEAKSPDMEEVPNDIGPVGCVLNRQEPEPRGCEAACSPRPSRPASHVPTWP